MNKYKREFLKSLVLSCIIYVVLVVVNLSLGEKIEWNSKMLTDFLNTVMYTVGIYGANVFVFITLDRIYKDDRFHVKRLLVGFVSSFCATVLVAFLLRIFLKVWIYKTDFRTFLREENFSNYLFTIIIFFIISLAIHAFYFYKSYQENKVREQKIIAGTASAKFESLKNQIDPHFLFNSLNVLSSLIEENPENAQRFTTSLSKVYRYVLEQKDKDLVSVEEELTFAKTYMNLLKMRFENSLFYDLPDVDIDPEAKVVPLSLQLLLENTVKHNVVSEQKPLHIRIYIENDYLCIQNDYRPKEAMQERQGVGLQNIVNRYDIITRRKVMIEQTLDTFTVKIPILTKKIMVTETENKTGQDNYYKAQKKVEDIKGFYGNLISYIVVIVGCAIINLVTYPQFLWFLFPMGGWGIGVLVHGMAVFNYVPFLSRDWEEKKIRQFMEKEKLKNWK